MGTRNSFLSARIDSEIKHNLSDLANESNYTLSDLINHILKSYLINPKNYSEGKKKNPNKIRYMRKQKKLTQAKMAEDIGISQNTLHQYETGKRNPNEETLERIADYLGVTSDLLVGSPKARNVKPPLGLMPKLFWDNERIADITNAVNRYMQEQQEIPIEWIEEYNNLVKKQS